MASQKDAGIISYTFLWNIQNISYCWHKQGECIESPRFIVDEFRSGEFQNTHWKLRLFPRGSETADYISCKLYRGTECEEPDSIEIGFELALLASDGSSLMSKRTEEYTFCKGESRGFKELAKGEDVFKLRKDEFIPQNTLVVRCRMWRVDMKMSQGVCCVAKTRIHVEFRAFHWSINQFASLVFWNPAIFKIKSLSKEPLISLELYLTDGRDKGERFEIKIYSETQEMKYLKFVSYELNCKEKVNSTPKEYFCDGPGKIGTFTLPVSEKKLIIFRNQHKPQDVLSLHCECAFASGIICDEIERLSCGSCPLGNSLLVYNSNIPDLLEVTPDVSVSLKDDLRNLYEGGILCDTKLCTKTASIPAHTVVLSARSPVFRAMFTSDMKEEAKECVHITDIDDDTLHRMVMYVYTDVLEDIQWEKASLLYAAANKYDIHTLKNKCSSILKSSLCQANVCEILVLADMHQDVDLKRDAQDYVLKNDVTVLQSKEWKLFMDTNVKLAAETMYRNWYNG